MSRLSVVGISKMNGFRPVVRIKRGLEDPSEGAKRSDLTGV